MTTTPRPMPENGPAGVATRLLNAVALLALTLVYAVHFYHVAGHAVDVPFGDEWDVIHGMSRSFDPAWLFERHNEHRHTLTYLQIWLLYRVNHWDVATHIVLNFVLFGGVVVTLALTLRRACAAFPFWVLAAFLLPLLSGFLGEVHSWAMLSAFHFFLLFFLLSAWCLFSPRPRAWKLALGALFQLLSVFSFGAGVPCVVGLTVVFAIYQAHRIRRGVPARPACAALVLVAGACSLWVALWSIGYQKVPGHPDAVLPNRMRFWEVLGDAAGLAFGFNGVSGPLGAICLLFLVAPLALCAVWSPMRRGAFLAVAVAASLLLCLAAIVAGRAGFSLGVRENMRYGEPAMCLLPAAAVLWFLALRGRPVARNAVLAAMFVLAMVGTRDNWNFEREYAPVSTRRNVGVQALTQYYEIVHVERRKIPAQGPSITALYPPGWMGDRVQHAEDLDLSCFRKIRERSRRADTIAP